MTSNVRAQNKGPCNDSEVVITTSISAPAPGYKSNVRIDEGREKLANPCTGPVGPRGPIGIPGVNGTNGTDGANGAPGAPGVGVPTGGTTGQILTKTSNVDYATDWEDPPAVLNALINLSSDTTLDLTGAVQLTALVDTSGGDVTITLPDVILSASKICNVKKMSALNTLIIAATGADTFYSFEPGASTLSVDADGFSFCLQADSTNTRWAMI